MFGDPRYLHSNFSVIFHEQRLLVARERQISKQLTPLYFPPHVAERIGDDNEREPVLAFQSPHGHSQILVSSTLAMLNVRYSRDWQTNIEAGREYVVERAQLLFDVIRALTPDSPLYCGLVTRVRISANASDQEIAAFVARTYLNAYSPSEIHDAQIRVTNVIDDTFFSNLLIQNYRSWSIASPGMGPLRLSRNRASEHGIEIENDFNSRYAFNEDKEYHVTKDSVPVIVSKSVDVLSEAIRRIQEASQ